MRSLLSLLIPVLVVACTTAGSDSTTTSEAVTTTTDSPTTTEASGGGDQCLVGSWVLNNESFGAEMEDLFATSGIADAQVSPLGGSLVVEFAAEGSLTATREDWGWEVLFAGSTFRVEVNGTETGTWSTEGSTLRTTTDLSDVVAESSLVIDGEELTMPPGMEDSIPIPETLTGQSEFSCDGETLTITNEAMTSVFARA